MKKYFGLILVIGGVVGLVAGTLMVSGGIIIAGSWGDNLRMPIGIASIAFGAIFFYQGLRFMMAKSSAQKKMEEKFKALDEAD